MAVTVEGAVAPDPVDEHSAFFDVLTTARVLGPLCRDWAQARQIARIEDRVSDVQVQTYPFSLGRIAVTGYLGDGCNESVLDARCYPIRMRFLAGRPDVRLLAEELEAQLMARAG